MKTVCKRLVSGLLAVLMLSTVMLGSCAAAPKASDYFARTEVWCTNKGNGKFIVEYDVVATRTMAELGVSAIAIYKQQSNGSYTKVKTYNWDNTTGLTVTDDGTKYGCVWYQGVAGVKYYASVTFYARPYGSGSTGYLLGQSTDVITAA